MCGIIFGGPQISTKHKIKIQICQRNEQLSEKLKSQYPQLILSSVQGMETGCKINIHVNWLNGQ